MTAFREPYEADEEFTWQPYRVRPLAVWAMRMNTEFECRSLQGTLRGKEGDWMVRSEDGAEFPVPDEVFRRQYVKREWRKPNEQQKESNAAPPQAHAPHL